jgi:FtsP/CotA-like multicopper oxidase with cupredoxin domain
MRATSVVMFLLTVVGAAAKPVPFSNPPVLSSENGVLGSTLTVAPAEVSIGGKTVTTTVFNGLYMPPVLKVQPGDQVKLELVDGGDFPVNIHYHGTLTTPLGPGDNVFITVNPGATFDYDFPIPTNHPHGLFWYHPHVHPMVNRSIAAGLSGGLVVGDVLGGFPGLQGITENFLLLKDMKIKKGAPVEDPDPTGPTRRTVNGLFRPRLEIRPGELQLWRIGNIGANIYYRLRLDRKVPFYVLAQDGNIKNQLVETTELLVPPGARYEVLVRGPKKKGTYRLRALKYDTGPSGDHYPGQVLLSMRNSGAAVSPEIPLPTTFPTVPDLREEKATGQRTIVFADTPNPNLFTINDLPYDHDRIDTTVTLGSLEEWTVQNTATEEHVFHIHQTDFQVVEINGQPQPFTGYQDTVNLPVATKKGGASSVKILIPFRDPTMVGEFVYHCHIVQHADQGMMANIQVVDPSAVGPPAP